MQLNKKLLRRKAVDLSDGCNVLVACVVNAYVGSIDERSILHPDLVFGIVSSKHLPLIVHKISILWNAMVEDGA